MYTELFRKVRKEVERELSEKPNSFLNDVAERAMDKHRVPTEERETFLYALSKKMKTEKGIERQKPEIKESTEETGKKQQMFSKEIWREIKKGAKEVASKETLLDAIDKGDISKENLEGKEIENEEYKKLKDFGLNLDRHPR